MSEFKLLILGPVRLETGEGSHIGPFGTKAKALLAYLATQPRGRAERDLLADLLWDSRPKAEARHALRQALLRIRGQLVDRAAALLESDRDSLQLRLEAVDVDLLQFKRALRSANDKALLEISRLWRGAFCAGLDVGAGPFEDWLLRERSQLDELAADGFARIAKIQAASGRFEAAVEAAQRRVVLNPFDDSAHAALIDLYGQRGWIGSARNAYRRCTDLFRRELDAVPNERVEAAIMRALQQQDRQPRRQSSSELSFGR